MFKFVFLLIIALFCTAVKAGTTMPKDFFVANNVSSSSSTCGGNCPGGCSSCPCGSSTSYQSISTWCSKHTWNQAHCQCIVSAESSGNANAANQNSDGSYDVGFWQINKLNWDSCNGGATPCSMNSNLACAIDVYNWGGKTWKFWSTCSKCGACSSS